MTVTGKLRTMSLADIMQWLAASHKSGILVIEGPKYTRKVFFRHGLMTGIASDNPREMLGYFLVGWGYCTEEQLAEMVHIQSERPIALGELSFELGHINRQQLSSLMEARMRESLSDLVVLEDGDFRFMENETPERPLLEVQLKVESFLLEAFRRRDELMRLRQILPDTSAIPVLIAPPDGLEPDQIALTLEMDGRRSIETLALEHRMAPFDVLKLIGHCLGQGLMQILPPEDDKARLPGYSQDPLRLASVGILDRISRGRTLSALKMITEARNRHPDRSAALLWADQLSRTLENWLDENSVGESDIIEPALKVDDLVNLECAPEEGFILSRITGFYTLAQILQQLPGSELSNRSIVHNLLRRGLIKIRKATSVRRFRSPEEEIQPLSPKNTQEH